MENKQMNQQVANQQTVVNNVAPQPSQNPSNANGRWVPVDMSSVAFPMPAEENKAFIGPDNATYIISQGAPSLGAVSANSNNAIPTPASIVQMPPIIQPIALVPYASQNQPMLQYDPYSRPLPPEQTAPAPVYVEKPYKGVSFVAILLSLITMTVVLLGNVIGGSVFKSNGLDMIYALLAIFGVNIESTYITEFVSNKMDISSFSAIGKAFQTDFLSSLVAVVLPIVVVLTLVVAFFIVMKYLFRIIKGKSPRNFSILALLNLILTALIVVLVFAISKGYSKDFSVKEFFALQQPIIVGIAVIANIILSLAVLICPFFTIKNAKMVEGDNKRIYIVKG